MTIIATTMQDTKTPRLTKVFARPSKPNKESKPSVLISGIVGNMPIMPSKIETITLNIDSIIIKSFLSSRAIKRKVFVFAIFTTIRTIEELIQLKAQNKDDKKKEIGKNEE